MVSQVTVVESQVATTVESDVVVFSSEEEEQAVKKPTILRMRTSFFIFF